VPRLNNSDELFKAVTKLELFRLKTSTPGSTTVSSNALVQATSLAVAAITNFADDDYIFINGSGGFELNQIDGSPTSGNLPLEFKLGKAQSSGATVKEAELVALGKIEQGGVTIGSSFTQTAIFSAQDTSAIGYFAGEGELSFNFALLGLNGPNLSLALGAPETEFGAGSTADPYITAITGTEIGSLSNIVIRLTGTRFDATSFHIDLCDAKIEGGGQIQFGRQTASGIPVSGKCTAWYVRHPLA
jgi:hypothetical protein